jgi:hypothetical protein
VGGVVAANDATKFIVFGGWVMTFISISQCLHVQSWRHLALYLSLLICTFLASCSPKFDVAEWTEEVMLHDGRTITVWRRAVAKSGGFPEPRGADIEFELKYEAMGVHWKGGPHRPLFSFDIVDGTPWMTTHIGDRETCRGMKKTDFSAAYYKWQAGQWIEVKQPDAPLEILRRNLWIYYWGREPKDDSKGHIDWAKKQFDGNVKTPPESIQQRLSKFNHYCALHHSM